MHLKSWNMSQFKNLQILVDLKMGKVLQLYTIMAAGKIKYPEQHLQLQKYYFYWSENDNCLPSLGTGIKGWKKVYFEDTESKQ